VCYRASLWALSSRIAGVGRGQDPAAETSADVNSLVFAVDWAVKVALQDDRVAADMPAAYEWLASLGQ
jgi:hypothetical protein